MYFCFTLSDGSFLFRCTLFIIISVLTDYQLSFVEFENRSMVTVWRKRGRSSLTTTMAMTWRRHDDTALRKSAIRATRGLSACRSDLQSLTRGKDFHSMPVDKPAPTPGRLGNIKLREIPRRDATLNAFPAVFVTKVSDSRQITWDDRRPWSRPAIIKNESRLVKNASATFFYTHLFFSIKFLFKFEEKCTRVMSKITLHFRVSGKHSLFFELMS